MEKQSAITRFLELALEVEFFFSGYVENWLNDPSSWHRGGAAREKERLLRIANELKDVVDIVEPIVVQLDPGASICETKIFQKPDDDADHWKALFAERTIIAATALGASVEALFEVARDLTDYGTRELPAEFGEMSGFGSSVFTSLNVDHSECRRLSARIRRERMLVETFAELPHQKAAFTRADLMAMTGIEDHETVRNYLKDAGLPVPAGRGGRQTPLSRSQTVTFLETVIKSSSVQFHRRTRSSLKELQASMPNSNSD